MKYTFAFLTGLLSLLLMSGCGGASNSPSGVVDGFLSALADGDFEAAAEFFEADEREGFVNRHSNLGGTAISQMKENYADFEILEETYYAEVRVRTADRVETVDLIKIDGTWYLD